MRVGPMTPSTPTTESGAPYGRRHHAAVIEDLIAGFVADEDLHALGPQAVVEQVQEIALLVERLEEAPQLLDARELPHPHEIGLALDDVLELVIAADAGLEYVLRHGDGIEHDLVHVGAGLAELAQDLLAHLRQRAAAELLVEKVGGALELVGGVVALQLDDAVLHFALAVHQHDQHAVLGES